MTILLILIVATAVAGITGTVIELRRERHPRIATDRTRMMPPRLG